MRVCRSILFRGRVWEVINSARSSKKNDARSTVNETRLQVLRSRSREGWRLKKTEKWLRGGGGKRVTICIQRSRSRQGKSTATGGNNVFRRWHFYRATTHTPSHPPPPVRPEAFVVSNALCELHCKISL